MHVCVSACVHVLMCVCVCVCVCACVCRRSVIWSDVSARAFAVTGLSIVHPDNICMHCSGGRGEGGGLCLYTLHYIFVCASSQHDGRVWLLSLHVHYRRDVSSHLGHMRC